MDKGIACKLCIMEKGLKGNEMDTCGYVFKTEEEFIQHLENYHHFKIKNKPEKNG
jgi:uncharacterized C2H2 Zn-finger protein